MKGLQNMTWNQLTKLLRDDATGITGELREEVVNRSKYIHSLQWCDRSTDICGYNNSYITVQIFDPFLNKEDAADLFYLSGIQDSVFYPECKNGIVTFDIHKGDFEQVRKLSTKHPGSVVFANSDWDDHSFCIFLDGKTYDEYKVEWNGEIPEPYKEDDETYYDCDVIVKISLPDGSKATCYSGGGMCSEEEYERYAEAVAQNAFVATIHVTMEKFKDPIVRKEIRNLASNFNSIIIDVSDDSFGNGAYWKVQLSKCADEGVSLMADPNNELASWGYDEQGNWHAEGHGNMKVEKINDICKRKNDFFEQLIEFSETFRYVRDVKQTGQKYYVNCWIHAHYDVEVEGASSFEEALEMVKAGGGETDCNLGGLDIYESGYTSVSDEKGNEK